MMIATTPMSQKLQRRQAPLYALFAANAISLIGSQLTLIAIPWFVLVTTGSAAKTGITAFVEALSAVIAAILGGSLVDRLGHKRASVLADLTSGAIVALIPLLHHTIGLAFWQLLVLVFLRSFCDTPGNTARGALRPDTAARAGMSPERANAAFQGIQRGARLLGAPIAGALVALLGASDVLWLDAASFVISAVLVAALLPASTVVQVARERYFATIAAGFRFLRRDRALLAIATTVAIANFLDGPLFAVIMPVYVRQTFGNAANLGLMIAAFGGGALLGTLIFGATGTRLPRRATFVGAFIMASLPFWVLVLLPPLPVILGALVV
jgi:MFS family permease